MRHGFEVTKTIEGARPDMEYPLLPGDILVAMDDGTYFKEAPGIAVGGFVIDAQTMENSTQPVKFLNRGLGYTVIRD